MEFSDTPLGGASTCLITTFLKQTLIGLTTLIFGFVAKSDTNDKYNKTKQTNK